MFQTKKVISFKGFGSEGLDSVLPDNYLSISFEFMNHLYRKRTDNLVKPSKPVDTI